MRYKLIPAKRRHVASVEFNGSEQGARWDGEDLSVELGCRVLVVAAPLGGIRREIGLVGEDPEPVAAMKRKQ